MNRTQVARGVAIALALGSTFAAAPTFADTTAQTLPFSQSWSTGLITANDNWSGVPGITGYNEDLTGSTSGVDPQTRLAPMTTVKVLANQTNTGISNGGLAEFEITDPVVAFQGANTSDAPNLVIHLNTTGKQDIVVSYKLRDLDGSADDAIMAVALQYRIGTTGDFVNVPEGYKADVTTAGSATQVTSVSATLPAAANNAPMVQVRILTTNAAGNDEWVGVDDISVTGTDSTGDTAPAVSGTSPSDNATGVALGGNITVTFDEDVALNDAGVTLNCGSGALPFSLTGGPRTFTLDPASDLPDAATCTVTIASTAVADVDANDPPDGLASNYVFDFQTVSLADAAPTVAATSPADNAIGVIESVDLSVTFSEDVSRNAAGVTLNCGAGNLPFAVSGGPRTFTVNPDADLPNSATCVVTIGAGAVSDADAMDPPDGLAADHVFDFATAVQPALIGAVQGTGDVSPMKDQTVTVGGIVTAKSTAGFWLQDAGDGNPASSDGVYVFGSSVVGQVAVGDSVRVTGKVLEYKPSADPQQLHLTEIGGTLSVVKLSSGNALPAAVDLSLPANLPTANGGLLQLERFEGMRVTVPSLDVVTPNGSSDYNGSKFADTFFGVVSGTARPRREAGVDAHDLLPAGSPLNVPRWDANPELLRIRTNGVAGGGAFDARGGSVVANVTGPLDYAYRRYTIQNQGAPTVLTPAPEGVAVTAPDAQGFTVGSFNVENYADANGTSAKAQKISRVIRDYLHAPDLLGFIEMGTGAYAKLAQKIDEHAVAAGQAAPNYGTDVIGTGSGTQQLAVAYKRAEVRPGVPRVQILGWEQFGATENLRCPDGSIPPAPVAADPLLDRPPLLVRAQINHANGGSFPVSMMMLHLKALSEIDSTDAPLQGWECFATLGERNRAKRHQGAAYVANLIAARQTANPAERLIVVGDYNAYEFNDGYVDVVGTIVGDPATDDRTVQPGDGIDLVTPDLFNLSETAPTPYSYVFGGHAQILDHLVVNQGLIDGTLDARVEYAHVNADYNAADASNAAVVMRSSDHDPVHLYAAPIAFRTSDLGVNASAAGLVRVGDALRYAVNVRNDGADTAYDVAVSFDVAALARFAAVDAPAGWSCNEPVVGAPTAFSCTIATLASGATAAFELDVTIDPAAAWTSFAGTFAATAASTDPQSANDSADVQSSTALIEDAALQLSVQNAADARPGATVTWRALLTTAEHTFPLEDVVVSVPVPAGMRYVGLSVPNAAGTSPVCTAQGASGSETGASCTFDEIAAGNTIALDFSAKIADGATAGTVHTVNASVTSSATEASTANNQASAAVTVLPRPTQHADLMLSMAGPSGTVDAGTTATYVITLENLGPDAAQNAQVTIAAPAHGTFGTIDAPAGWTCAPNGNARVCSAASLANGATATFDVDVAIDAEAPCCSVALSATAGTASEDAIAANDAAQATTTIATMPDLSLTMVNNKGSALRGDQVLWTATVSNAVGAMAASNVVLNVTLPDTVRFASIGAPAGWSCTTPAVNASGTVQCAKTSLAGGAATSIEIGTTISPNAPVNSTIAMDASVASASTEATSSNNQASAPLTIAGTPSIGIFTSGFEE